MRLNRENMLVLKGVVVILVAMGTVSAAPGFGQGETFFGTNGGNTVGFGVSNNNNFNNYKNDDKLAYNSNLAYTTSGLGHTANNIYSNNNGYNTNSIGYISGQQQAFSSSSHEYPKTGHSGFSVASPDLSYDSHGPTSGYGTGTAANEITDSSPALSALALLGFLYLLNMIQDVLQNNSGRKRRSLPLSVREGKNFQEEEEGHYITSYLEEGLDTGGDGDDGDDGGKEEEEARGRSQGSEPRAYSFLEDFFIRLPHALGMRQRQTVDRMGQGGRPTALGDFISSRLNMISSIMSFLQDPSPSRIRRVAEDVDPEKDESESFLIPSLSSFLPLVAEVYKDFYSPLNFWLPEEERAFTQGDTSGSSAYMEGKESIGDEENKKDILEEEETGEVKERRRRYSYTSMNAWYSEMGGRNSEPDEGVGGVAAKAISLLGGNDVVQEAVKQEAAPALLELSKGLMGAHPHCLQRVLCRLTSHANHLSLLPRMALHILSSNMVPENEQAMKAGLRGENCSQTFSECDTDSKSREA